MAKERRPISAKTRYEVLSRDSFTCKACGGKAPNVTLQVDHVTAVANGGSDDIENLRTLCVTCNLGKSDTAMEVAKVEAPVETGKHPLVGWAFLSYRGKDDKGHFQVQYQGTIKAVVPSGAPIGDLVIIDLFEWFIGEYTHSMAVPITEFAEPYGSDRGFYKLFASWQERNDYYDWKHGKRSVDD